MGSFPPRPGSLWPLGRDVNPVPGRRFGSSRGPLWCEWLTFTGRRANNLNGSTSHSQKVRRWPSSFPFPHHRQNLSHQLRTAEQQKQRGSFWGGSRAAVSTMALLQYAEERPSPVSMWWSPWTITHLSEEAIAHAANLTHRRAWAQNQHCDAQ